jgi:hypothetical protein
VKARILEGDYSPDELARFLLWAAGSLREAKKALTRASNEKPQRTSDDMVFLAAYSIKKKFGCEDHTALRKLFRDKDGKLTGKYRVYWDRLNARGQTLEEIARMYSSAESTP